MAKIIRLPAPRDSDDQTRANEERTHRLFQWAAGVLRDLGLTKAVARATSVAELDGITLNLDGAEVSLAIRDVLHPATGDRQDHFRGLRKGALKQILKNRFNDLKRDREKVLRRRAGAERDWTSELILTKDGKVVANLANLILILRKAPKWEGVLAYDEFNARVIVRRPAPWVGEKEVDAPWTDHHESMARAWLQKEGKINPTAGDVGRAVQAAAKHNKCHPARELFESFKWDGKPRDETYLIDYFHAEDTAYIRAIGPRWLIAAVARVHQPGCKVDNFPIFEGPQGKQKTEALRTLAIRDEWFSDRLISHIGSKHAALEMAGVLIIELAEMEALLRAAPSKQKSFLTSRRDRFVPPYGKHAITLPRQSVFAATINPPAGGHLTDPTGNRRPWPVACHGMIDRDGLERVRDQLWAEAVHRYKAGEPWWLETPELEALAAVEQEARFVVDAWEQPIREWLEGRTDVAIIEVLEHALGLSRDDRTQSAYNRVSKILTRLDFVHCRPRTEEGQREYRYRREPTLKKNSS